MKTILIILSIISLLSCKKDDSENNTVTDIDGKIYQTAMIGKHTWMTENLKVTRFKNGAILNIIPPKSTGNILLVPGYALYKNEFFYNSAAVNDLKGLAPKGWHIPTLAEFEDLRTDFQNNTSFLNSFGFKDIGSYINWLGGAGALDGIVLYSSHTAGCSAFSNVCYWFKSTGKLGLFSPECLDGKEDYLNIRCVKD